MRLIDADALYMDIIHRFDYCDDFLEMLESAPTVDVLPIKEKCCYCPHCTNCDVNDDLTINQPEPQWIPCSERLPEKPVGVCYFDHDGKDVPGKEYIVMIEDAIEPTSLYWTGDVWFSPYGIDKDTEYDVIAWMPLPEPYKEG